jgi:hypothetical protein
MPSPTRTGRGRRAPKLDFEVTAEVIERSIPAHSGHCMIADGLKAAMPHATDVSVDLATIRYTDRKARRRYVYLTPPDAQDALLDFDNGVRPEPFSVAAHAAQIRDLPAAKPKKAVKDKKIPLTKSGGDEPKDEKIPLTETPAEPSKRKMATVMNNPAGGGTVPIKVGGNLPAMGALAGGAGSHNARTGRERRFGLRAMGRARRQLSEE